MWGKPKSELAASMHLHIPCPRMTAAEKRLKLVLYYVERMLGHPMSTMDAEVLIEKTREEADQDESEKQ